MLVKQRNSISEPSQSRNRTLDSSLAPLTTLELSLRTAAMLVKKRNSITETSQSRNSTMTPNHVKLAGTTSIIMGVSLRTSTMLLKQWNSISEPSKFTNCTLDTTMWNSPAQSTTLEMSLRTSVMLVKQRNSISAGWLSQCMCFHLQQWRPQPFLVAMRWKSIAESLWAGPGRSKPDTNFTPFPVAIDSFSTGFSWFKASDCCHWPSASTCIVAQALRSSWTQRRKRKAVVLTRSTVLLRGSHCQFYNSGDIRKTPM